MFRQDEIDFIEAKKNLNKQALMVLQDIVNAYQKGILDDPGKAEVYCNILACICEGKIAGEMDNTTMEVKWALSEEYKSYLETIRKPADSTIVQGPWQQCRMYSKPATLLDSSETLGLATPMDQVRWELF